MSLLYSVQEYKQLCVFVNLLSRVPVPVDQTLLSPHESGRIFETIELLVLWEVDIEVLKEVNALGLAS